MMATSWRMRMKRAIWFSMALILGLGLLGACQPDGDTREGAGWTGGGDPARLGDERAGQPIDPPPATRAPAPVQR